jgi:hypothetical protein
MGWQDDSTPVLPSASSSTSSAASNDAPGYFTIENQLGPFAAMFGYKQRDPPKSIGQQVQDVADVGRVAADQVPFVGNAFDVAGAQKRLQGTPYQGAGEALGMAGTGAATEALGAGRYVAGQLAPQIGRVLPEGVSSFLASRLGGAAEQGTIAAAGTAGHGGSASDTAKAFGVGGTIGSVLGSGAKEAPVGRSADELKQANEAAWKAAEQTSVNPQTVANALGWTKQSLTPGEQMILKSSGLNNAVNQAGRTALNAGSMSVDDVAKFQGALQDAARSGSEQRLASKFSGALANGLGPNESSVLQQANAATNTMKTDRDISGWLEDPKSAPAKIKSALVANPDFYDSQPGLKDALTQISQSGQPSMTQNIIHDLATRLFKGAATAVAGGPVAGAVTAAVAPTVKAGIRAAPIRNSLLAAQHLNSTGLKLDPSAFAQPGVISNTGDLLRQATAAAGARGSL